MHEDDNQDRQDKSAVSDFTTLAGGAPLTYRNPAEDTRPAWAYELAGAAILTTIIWVGAIIGLIFFVFAMDYRGEGNPHGVAGAIIALTAGAVFLGATILLALRWQRRPDRRHLAIGVWIGLGVACLIEGVCFVSVN